MSQAQINPILHLTSNLGAKVRQNTQTTKIFIPFFFSPLNFL